MLDFIDYPNKEERKKASIIGMPQGGYSLNDHKNELFTGIFIRMPRPKDIPKNCFAAIAIMSRIASIRGGKNHIRNPQIAKQFHITTRYIREIFRLLEQQGLVGYEGELRWVKSVKYNKIKGIT